jgi:hypothetical protein
LGAPVSQPCRKLSAKIPPHFCGMDDERAGMPLMAVRAGALKKDDSPFSNQKWFKIE